MTCQRNLDELAEQLERWIEWQRRDSQRTDRTSVILAILLVLASFIAMGFELGR
jgi:hypothetical protein